MQLFSQQIEIMEKIMPVSASQHRASIGAQQNMLNKNIKNTIFTNNSIIHSTIKDDIHHFGNRIHRITNYHNELNKSPTLNPVSSRGMAAPLLLLLSQIRLADNPILESYPTSIINGYSSPLVFNNSHEIEKSNKLTTAISNYLPHEVLKFGASVFQFDPLRFPTADASPLLSTRTDPRKQNEIIIEKKSDGCIITDEHKKSELISQLVDYFVSEGQLTINDSEDFKLWLRFEAAGKPMFIGNLDDKVPNVYRSKRALARELDPRTLKHIEKHCAFEEEVLNAEGDNEGKLLIFQAQRAENPFRMIYDNSDGNPSPEARGVADGLNIATNILTLGIKPFISKIIANTKHQQYYQSQGNDICAERFKRLSLAEILTFFSADALPYKTSGLTKKVKPYELFNTLPTKGRAAFYTKNPLNGIRKEILLELKQGNGVINDNGNAIYLKPAKNPNEFFTYYPNARNPTQLERRVIVDEDNLSWRYADEYNSSNLNVKIIEGKNQIQLYGEYYELQQNGIGEYEIIIKKESGIKEFIPVYMEPLSQTWHLSTHNKHPSFTNKQIETIKKIRVKKEDGFYYVPTGNNNPNYYGNGNIYGQRKIGDTSNYTWGRYIEMNSELIPVRNTEHLGQGVLYEVYDSKNPLNSGYPIEWDGRRWLFERKTSAHVSNELISMITPEMSISKIDARKLSAPDHIGFKHSEEGDKYIKINDNYIKVEYSNGNYFIKKNANNVLYLDFKNNIIYPYKNLVKNGFDANRIAKIGMNSFVLISLSEYKNMYITENGHLFLRIDNDYFPAEFAGRDSRIILIGSPNELRSASIYQPNDGSLKKLSNNFNSGVLKYDKEIDVYKLSNIEDGSVKYSKFDRNAGELKDTNIISIDKINNKVNKVSFKKFDLFIGNKNSKDIYINAHGAADRSLSSKIPENFELDFYTKKGTYLHGYVDDLPDLLKGKFPIVEKKKGPDTIEGYEIAFDHDSQINYSKLADELKKNIIRVPENKGVKLNEILIDLSLLYHENKSLHLYICRAF